LWINQRRLRHQQRLRLSPESKLLMLIIHPLPQGHPYPQITQFPTDYTDFLAAFRDGQTIDDNLDSTVTKQSTQFMMLTTAFNSKHLEKRGNPLRGLGQGYFLLDIFLTEKGAAMIREPQDRPFCEQAVELAKKSIMENNGKLHPCVGAVVVKNGKVIATGFRGESGKGGDHAEFCALKKLGPDVDKVDLTDCTVYTTLEPCSERGETKTPCATRLINAKCARVVSGMPDKDKNVYGLSSLAEAKIHIGLFPNDLMQELLALNQKWSDTRRKSDTMPPPNCTSPLSNVSYNKPGTPMTDNIYLFVRPPKEGGEFFTVEDANKKVLAYARSINEIAVEWNRIQSEKLNLDKFKRVGGGSSDQRLTLI
jgi:pyrimidine deaminase RibD-like protein